MHFYAIFLVLLLTKADFSKSETCSTVGPLCDNNCNIALCPSVGAEPIVTGHCFQNTGKYCAYNATSYQYECSGATCSNVNVTRPFKCLQVGMMPSPYKCNTLLECLEVDAYPALECSCADGEIVDLTSYDCVKETCSRTPPVCDAPGHYGTWTNGICYICDEFLDAFTMRCDGKVAKAVDHKALNCKAYVPPPKL